MMMRGEVPLPAIATLIGFRIADVQPGMAAIEFEATERHANPMGTLHGGVLCDIADAAMGIAFATTLYDEETFTTIELKINFLRPVWVARLRATGTVVQRGRTIGLAQCDVTDEQQRLIARATCTCMALPGERIRTR